jgi:hypothetical protein
MNTAWMTPENGSSSGRGRQNEMVQSRLPAMSVLMHAAQTFRHPQISVMNWTEIVHITTLNWCCNPCPSVLFPNFVSQLVANTFDWSIWLVLLVFADYFGVPSLDLSMMEKLFSTDTTVLDGSGCTEMNSWLESIGFNATGQNHDHKYEVIYQPDNESLLTRTGVFVTDYWNIDEVDDTSVRTPLTANIERPNQYTQKDTGNKSIKSSMSWKVAEAVGTRMYQKYKTHLSSACNVESAVSFITMIYRHMNKPLHYPKFGSVPCGGGFQSFDGILKKLNSKASGTAIPGKVDSESYIDGADVSVCEHLKQNRVSYQVTPFTCINREGTIWSFCVEIRFLILAKALLGSRPAVSQMSIQGILDELTLWLVNDRLPATIFCENKFITTHPDNVGAGLNILSLNNAQRPLTMTRPLPNTAVEENSSMLLPGVVAGKMPEEFLIVNQQQRLAMRLSDDDLMLHHTHVHQEGLNIPSLPRGQWLPVHIVHKGPRHEYQDFDATEATYNDASVYIDIYSTQIFLTRAKDVQKPTGVNITMRSDTLIIDLHNPVCSTSVYEVLKLPNTEYVRFCPTFHREGIVLYIQETMSYCTLVAWPVNQMKQLNIGPPLVYAPDGHYFFNPSSMGYLVKQEAAPNTGQSACIWPEAVDVLDQIRNNIPSSQSRLLTNNNASAISMSNVDVEKCIQPVGSNMYIDLEHQLIPDDLTKQLVFKEVLSIDHAEQLTPSDKRFLSKNEYMREFGNIRPLHGLLKCMLLYTLPEEVVNRQVSTIENPIWVSVVQLLTVNGKTRKRVYHIVVPTRALIPLERLQALGITPVLFDSHVTVR